MAHLKQSNRRRSSSSLCHRHPSAKPSSGFCASCLRERLVTIEAESSSSPAAFQPPELRRIRSHSVRNASAAASVSEQPRRRSCDNARSSASSLQNLFVDDDDGEKRLGLSNRKPLVSDLKEEEEEEDYYDGEDIKESGGEQEKTMKEFIDLDWGSQIKKSNDLASIWSRKLKRFSLSHHHLHHKERRGEDEEKLPGRRRSCDVDLDCLGSRSRNLGRLGMDV